MKWKITNLKPSCEEYILNMSKVSTAKIKPFFCINLLLTFKMFFLKLFLNLLWVIQNRNSNFRYWNPYSVNVSAALMNFLQVGVGKIFHSCKFPDNASNLFMHSNCVWTQSIIFIPSESDDKFKSRHPSLVSKPTNATAVKKKNLYIVSKFWIISYKNKHLRRNFIIGNKKISSWINMPIW